MINLYKKYCTEQLDKNGCLEKFELNCPDNFNFAYDIVDTIASHQPNHIALKWANQLGAEKTITFEEMSKTSNRIANMLLEKGVTKGDKVLVILKRHYEFWFTVVALHKIGAVVIPATNLLTKKDIVYRTNVADIKTVICTGTGEVAKFLDQAEQECGAYKNKFMVNGVADGNWLDLMAQSEQYSDQLERIEVQKTDEMLGYFTSGTTGNPKMVLHNYSYPLAHIITAKYWHCSEYNGLHLTLAETGWAKAAWGKIYGQWITASPLFVYDFDKFVPQEILSMIEKYSVTTFCAPPTVFRFLIKEGMNTEQVKSLNHVSVAGEALNEEVYNKFKEITGLSLMEGFGQTETVLLIGTLTGMKAKPGSMGKASPLFNISVVDEQLNDVPAGTVGEIVVRTKEKDNYGMLIHYHNDEETTIRAWKDDIYHTGDTAYQDEDGYLWFVGRVDDIIKASGYRIGPFEVESVLMEHPSVLECAVTGAPDPERGVVIKATIVLTSHYTASDELKKELQDFVKKSTAPYKYPRIVEFVDELPKTISGKIRRTEIRKNSK